MEGQAPTHRRFFSPQRYGYHFQGAKTRSNLKVPLLCTQAWGCGRALVLTPRREEMVSGPAPVVGDDPGETALPELLHNATYELELVHQSRATVRPAPPGPGAAPQSDKSDKSETLGSEYTAAV